MSSLLVVVQRLSFEWGKEARGGPLATRRTQALKHALLPTWNLKLSTTALVQVLELNDADVFAQARERV
ncbi:hypothetical protein DAETH_10430 [Deinococcus aetherius]|uniref:Uncharacterized protein n=1 Tax=Deinococcus aetherius TaxID=200252 RepID=A0ABN6RDY1_9DEIO|nr:hypothetical protein DAETH_10430 [Deinococcus aetherius]